MLIIEPHYLGSLEYFSILTQQQKILFEVSDTFKKQTYRNRAYLLGSNRVLQVNVPLTFSNGTITKDVKVDYHHRWVKDHWGAFYSSYGKAPFFEYFKDDFKSIWDNKPIYLLDLNLDFMNLIFKILKTKIKFELSTEYKKSYDLDLRNAINPKSSYTDRKNYRPAKYTQLFGDTFVPNLSIVDLLMCEGPKASEVLKASYYSNN